MCVLRLIGRALLCATSTLGVADVIIAEPILLVEIHNKGLRNLTSGQPEMGFSFRIGEVGSQWLLFATEADVGKEYSAPPHLLSLYDEHLTSPNDVFISLGCCEATEHGFDSPPALNFGYTEGDQLEVTRIAPNLGPNLVGYRLTEITQTIDQIIITPVPGSGGLYNRSGAHTVRMYGNVIPEPATSLIMATSYLIVLLLRMRATGW